MAATDKSFLERHREKWRVTVFVPLAARSRIGKSHLKEALNTSDLAVANLLKHAIVGRFKEQIADAMQSAKSNDIYETARQIRKASASAPRRVHSQTVADRLGRESTLEVEHDDEAFYAVELAEKLEERHGEHRATEFADIALGRSTPLSEHLEAFLDDHGYQPKSVLEMRRAVERLGAWLAANKHPTTLQAITPEVGAAFLRYQVVGMGLTPKSVSGKYGSFLRTYWLWLIDHNHLPAHSAPWSARLPKQRSTGRHSDLLPDAGKRPYRPEELLKLLKGSNSAMVTLTKLGALTGMRIEELYRLRVRDVVDGYLQVHDGKTVNAKRRVPVHKDLEEVIKHLREGKAAGAYLIDPDAPVIEKTGLRSGAASKAFGYYRKALGVDERPNGKLKSNIDFHSLRRWFIASARDGLLRGEKGYNQWTIAEVAGHEDGLTDTLKMTMGLYAGTSGDEALRACVAAVKLPN